MDNFQIVFNVLYVSINCSLTQVKRIVLDVCLSIKRESHIEAWLFCIQKVWKIVNILIEFIHDQHVEKNSVCVGGRISYYVKIKIFHVNYVTYDDISLMQIHAKV